MGTVVLIALFMAYTFISLSSSQVSEVVSTSGKRLSRVIALGRALYFDKRLSLDGTLSCAACHDPATAFASKDVLAIGISNQVGTRNVPTVLNAVFADSYFWDGRTTSLEEQAKQPLLNPAEMGMQNEAALVRRLSSIDEYRRKFRQLFPREGITLETVAKAIAAYERTLRSGSAPFDRFMAGDKNAITDAQRNGWELFKGKAKCVECHTHMSAKPLFTDFKFHNTGIAAKDQDFASLARRAEQLVSRIGQIDRESGVLAHNLEFSDLGRFLVTRHPRDIGAFRTPALREVELTGPYMHNGSLKTLLDVLRFYNAGGTKNPNLDGKMSELNLTEEEMSDLVEFLRALTSDEILRQAQSSQPQTRTPAVLPHLGTHYE